MHDTPDPRRRQDAIDGHTPLAYTRFEVIESSLFTRQVKELLTEDSYRKLQLYLLLNPDAGDVIPGAGGLRKLRWRLAGRGKRGGARVIYMLRSAGARIHLLFMYAKNIRADLTAQDLRSLRRLISED